MPNMANIVVKAANGTTDVTYVALNASSGDRGTAYWRYEAQSTIAANRATIQTICKPAKNNTQRVTEVLFQYPEEVTNTTTNVKSVRLRDVGSVAFTICEDALSTTNDEAAAQFLNLLSSSLVKSILLSGRNAV